MISCNFLPFLDCLGCLVGLALVGGATGVGSSDGGRQYACSIITYIPYRKNAVIRIASANGKTNTIPVYIYIQIDPEPHLSYQYQHLPQVLFDYLLQILRLMLVLYP